MGTQGLHESVGVLLADNVNQGILKHLGTSLGNHSFRPDIEDYGNTRLKINDQRTAFLISDMSADSPQNIQPLALLRRIKGNFLSGAVRRRGILPTSQPDKIPRNQLPALRGITPDDLPLLVCRPERKMQRTRNLATWQCTGSGNRRIAR